MRVRIILMTAALATTALSAAASEASASTATGQGHCSIGSFTGPIAGGAGGMSGVVHFLQTQPGSVSGFTTGGYLTSGACS